jgi:PAS domain S-box-containing protein
MTARQPVDEPDDSQTTPQATLQSAVEAYAQANALFSSIGDGAVATDEFGKITKVNQAALDILGLKEKELLGAWFPKALQAFDDSGRPIKLMDRPITRAFLTGKPVIQRTLYKLKDGSLLPVACTVSPLVLAGRPIGAIELFRDISTEYEIDRMKSDFISLASHQLRTPLSAIKTYSHMLIDGFMGPLAPEQRKALRTIVSASNRMNELISTLLNVSRIETGNVIVSAKKINLNHIVDEIFKELALSADNKQITLSTKLPASPVIIKGDNLIVKEILINMVSNAIKYTPNGGQVLVQIRKGSRNVLISVKDNGMGIPKSAREQLFSKFYRAQNVVRHETSGTGLGLYLVKGLVETLNGKIWFESIENRGSTFYVRLPIEYSGRPITPTDAVEDLPILRAKRQ